MASRFRIGAALLGAIVALTFSALPAHADVIATPDQGDQPQGVYVALEDNPRLPAHKERYIKTEIIRLQIEGQKDTKVYAYCVELPTELTNGDVLREAPWGQHPNKNMEQFNKNAGKILWILTNSYPNLSFKDFVAKWGDQFKEGKKEDRIQEFIGATQAAIWHFSDGVDLDTSDNRNSENVKVLYTKFLEQAKDEPQPKPTLEIDPAEKQGEPGKSIGPFKVTTTASEVKLTANLPEGVTVTATDKDGNPVEAQKNDNDKVTFKGDKFAQFLVNVPAGAKDGEAKFTLSAEAELQLGRLFVAKDKASVGKDEVAQSLVVAQPQKAKVEKEGKASWKAGVTPPTTTTTTATTTTTTTPETTTPTTTSSTPANPAPGGGEDDLASTGASILWPLLGGLVLVGAGVGALFVVRRKKAGA